MMEFFLAMNPPTVTHQEHKITVVKGKPIFYDPPELKAARQKLMAYLGREVPEEPYRKGVRLVTKWCFPDDGNMAMVHTGSQNQTRTICRSC